MYVYKIIAYTIDLEFQNRKIIYYI